MYEFSAAYDEPGSAGAERSFYVRSVLHLRPWSTFGPPLFFALALLVSPALGVGQWFILFFSVLLALSIVTPLFFYFARPRAAKRLARQYPIRQLALTPAAIEITTGDRKATIGWPRVKHVWRTGDYTLLVLGKFAAVSIPTRCLPSGAEDFIRRAVASAGNAA